MRVFADGAGYDVCVFDTLDAGGRAIYHTNVMMAIGTQFAVICAATISGSRQRERVIERLTRTGRQVIDISLQQMEAFAGNLLEVQGFGRLLPVAVETIEQVGGGGARCMLAEIFLPVAGRNA